MYRQMYRYLRGQIEAGIYGIGDELPTTDQLERQFNTTSPTCGRHAYSQLIAEGLVNKDRDGRYVVAAITPPPVQTVTEAVDRIDALEASLNEALVALRTLRGELAGVQTPRCGQWWQVLSLALGADPIETSHAVCVRDRDTGELEWLASISNTWVRKPLHYFQPLRRLTYVEDWSDDGTGNGANTASGEPGNTSSVPTPTTVVVAGVAYYSADGDHQAHGHFEYYGPEQWTDGYFT